MAKKVSVASACPSCSPWNNDQWKTMNNIETSLSLDWSCRWSSWGFEYIFSRSPVFHWTSVTRSKEIDVRSSVDVEIISVLLPEAPMPLLDVCKVRLWWWWTILGPSCLVHVFVHDALPLPSSQIEKEWQKEEERTRREKLYLTPIRRTTKIEKKIASLVRWVSPISILNRNRKTEWTHISTAVPDASFSNARLHSALSSLPNDVVVAGTPGIDQAIALAIVRHCPTAHQTIIGQNQSAADAPLPQLGSNSKLIHTNVSLMLEISKTARQIPAVDQLISSQTILSVAGRVLFVQERLPLLRSSPIYGKVLFVLDGVRGNPSKINWNDMSLEHS